MIKHGLKCKKNLQNKTKQKKNNNDDSVEERALLPGVHLILWCVFELQSKKNKRKQKKTCYRTTTNFRFGLFVCYSKNGQKC